MHSKRILHCGQKDCRFLNAWTKCLLDKHNCCRLQFCLTAVDGPESAVHKDKTLIFDRELTPLNEEYLWTFNHTSLKCFLLWKGKWKVMKSNGSSHVNSLLEKHGIVRCRGGCLRLDSQHVTEPWSPENIPIFWKPPCGFQVYVVVLM